MISYIYRIYNSINPKSYVGQTTQPILDRFAQHISSAKVGKRSKLYDDIRELGEENFFVECLVEINEKTYEELLLVANKEEVKFISILDSINNGYNADGGGRHNPHKYKVAKYSFDGDLMEVFESQEDAAASVGGSNKGMSRACIGDKVTYYGFQWRKFYGVHPLAKLPKVRVPKRYKAMVAQYDLDGNFIKLFENTREALKETKSKNIPHVCLGKMHQSNGYQWRYYDGDKGNIGKVIYKLPANARRVVQLTLDGSFVSRYACINDAIKANPKATHLFEVCMGKRPNAGGFLWKYEEDYDGE